jgi:hypothetical protein
LQFAAVFVVETTIEMVLVAGVGELIKVCDCQVAVQPVVPEAVQNGVEVIAQPGAPPGQDCSPLQLLPQLCKELH